MVAAVDINNTRILRIPAILLLACILNLLIFYLIQHMVSRGQDITINQEIINLTDFIRLDRKPEKPNQDEIDEDINEPPPPEETPPPELIQPEISKPAPVQTETMCSKPRPQCCGQKCARIHSIP